MTLCYTDERGRWECNFVTSGSVFQVCARLTDDNRERELHGLLEATKRARSKRRLLVTLDQTDRIDIDVVAAWSWLAAGCAAKATKR